MSLQEIYEKGLPVWISTLIFVFLTSLIEGELNTESLSAIVYSLFVFFVGVFMQKGNLNKSLDNSDLTRSLAGADLFMGQSIGFIANACCAFLIILKLFFNATVSWPMMVVAFVTGQGVAVVFRKK